MHSLDISVGHMNVVKKNLVANIHEKQHLNTDILTKIKNEINLRNALTMTILYLKNHLKTVNVNNKNIDHELEENKEDLDQAQHQMHISDIILDPNEAKKLAQHQIYVDNINHVS